MTFSKSSIALASLALLGSSQAFACFVPTAGKQVVEEDRSNWPGFPSSIATIDIANATDYSRFNYTTVDRVDYSYSQINLEGVTYLALAKVAGGGVNSRCAEVIGAEVLSVVAVVDAKGDVVEDLVVPEGALIPLINAIKKLTDTGLYDFDWTDTWTVAVNEDSIQVSFFVTAPQTPAFDGSKIDPLPLPLFATATVALNANKRWALVGEITVD